MSVSSQTPINSSIGNGVTTSFPYTFKIITEDDLQVLVDGAEITSGFTVSGVGNDGGGAVVFSTAPANGTLVVRKRAMSYARSNAFQEGGDLLADTLNDDQDAPVLMIQQLAEEVGRCLKVEPGETPPGYVDPGGSDASSLSAALAQPSGADLVGFSHAETYAAGTVGDRLKQVVYVTDAPYLASPSALDNSTALQSFFTDIGNGTIKHGFIPSGNFKFATALTIPAESDWRLEGAGSACTFLTYTGANTSNDILTIGDGVANVINAKIEGVTIASDTTMTGGIGVHTKRLCRSSLLDFVIDGQDGSGNLWHGIRFNGVDNVMYDNFEVQAQKDGLQVNGLAGSNPKADLYLANYKIASCDVGVRCGGAFGGLHLGAGSFAVCGDAAIIDTTLVAEANREIFFSSSSVVDATTRSGVVVDQSISSQLFINLPANMWVASSGSHGIWIKNANGAKINIDCYVYNTTGDGIRIDDAAANINISGIFNNITQPGTYAINPTVATTLLRIATDCRFIGVTNTFNSTNNRSVCNVAFPINVQGGRSIYWDTYNGTLDGSGNASIAHGKGGAYYTKVIAVLASAKSSGNAWYPLTPAFIDGSNISITGSAPFAGRPYNVMCLVGDQANSGW